MRLQNYFIMAFWANSKFKHTTDMNNLIQIIGDGSSDLDVLKQFVKSIFEKHHEIEFPNDNFILSDIKPRDEVDRYFAESKKESKWGLYSDSAIKFKDKIKSLLFTAYNSLEKEKDSVNNHDLIVFSTDSEVCLGNKNKAYFEEWNYTINAVICLAIEEFYDDMSQRGYVYENLPMILPIIIFPSIEILVAAAMENYDINIDRTYKANPELKQRVWGTDSIPKAYDEGYIPLAIKEYITPENLHKIYKNVPEVRKFMQILAFYSIK